MAGEAVEREWTDQFGSHWEVRQRGADGRIHSLVLTKSRTSYGDREKARADVARAALTQKDPDHGG